MFPLLAVSQGIRLCRGALHTTLPRFVILRPGFRHGNYITCRCDAQGFAGYTNSPLSRRERVRVRGGFQMQMGRAPSS